MNYIELTIPCPDAQQSEIWMAELAEYPFESFEQGETILKAYIRQPDFEAVRSDVEEFMRSTGMRCTLTMIEDENWNVKWESQFDPVEVADRCVVRAPFHVAPPAGVMDLVIMPKMSFGTGHHATTWLMLSVMMDTEFEGKKVLDMGTGTGVLAIAASKMGASEVDAVDIDEWAYENSLENIAANGTANVRTVMGDVNAIPGNDYGVILANINRNILLGDMGRYCDLLIPGGLLIMSGILEQDMAAIEEKAVGLGLRRTGKTTKEGWAAVTYIK